MSVNVLIKQQADDDLSLTSTPNTKALLATPRSDDNSEGSSNQEGGTNTSHHSSKGPKHRNSKSAAGNSSTNNSSEASSIPTVFGMMLLLVAALPFSEHALGQYSPTYDWFSSSGIFKPCAENFLYFAGNADGGTLPYIRLCLSQMEEDEKRKKGEEAGNRLLENNDVTIQGKSSVLNKATVSSSSASSAEIELGGVTSLFKPMHLIHTGKPGSMEDSLCSSSNSLQGTEEFLNSSGIASCFSGTSAVGQQMLPAPSVHMNEVLFHGSESLRLHVLSYLPLIDVTNCRLANKKWHESAETLAPAPLPGSMFVRFPRHSKSHHHNRKHYRPNPPRQLLRWQCLYCMGFNSVVNDFCSCCNNQRVEIEHGVRRVFFGQLRKERTVELLDWLLAMLFPSMPILHIENHTNPNDGRGKGCAWVFVTSLSDENRLLKLNKRMFMDIDDFGNEGLWYCATSYIPQLHNMAGAQAYVQSRPVALPRQPLVVERPALRVLTKATPHRGVGFGGQTKQRRHKNNKGGGGSQQPQQPLLTQATESVSSSSPLSSCHNNGKEPKSPGVQSISSDSEHQQQQNTSNNNSLKSTSPSKGGRHGKRNAKMNFRLQQQAYLQQVAPPSYSILSPPPEYGGTGMTNAVTSATATTSCPYMASTPPTYNQTQQVPPMYPGEQVNVYYPQQGQLYASPPSYIATTGYGEHAPMGLMP